jgi:hypothetical protein
VSLYSYHAVANGLRTDHPIPDLPFVDDSHIPVEDPAGVEAIGRRHGTDMWGREDDVPRYGGWTAFTTDPQRHDLAWVVRWHPDHGRSVILYRDDEVSAVYMVFWDRPLLIRAGGYWWDGATWYRPGQVWDTAGEEFHRRPVPAAATVTAADRLVGGSADPARGRVLDVADVDPAESYEGRWLDDLARWAQPRDPDSLARSVVTLTAPELSADQMVGTAELAEIAGITSSTLRSYIARGEADVPLVQAVIGGRSLWSRPVAEEWVEQRERSSEGLTRAMSADKEGTPLGVSEAAAGLSRSFLATLWSYRPFRTRWALRWRNQDAVRQVADVLGRDAAEYMVRGLLPLDALSTTIEHAVLDQLAIGQQLARDTRDILNKDRTLHLAGPGDADDGHPYYGMAIGVARMLDWFIRHYPAFAGSLVGSITGEAERRLNIPRKVTERSLATALDLDGELEYDSLQEFLRRVMSPGSDTR